MAENPSRSIHPTGNLKQISASSNDLSPRPRALYIGVTGTMDVTNEDGTTESAVEVIAGSTIPYQPKKITAISDAAIYALYG